MKENHGYIAEKIDPTKHWIMGAANSKMKGAPLNPSGDWSHFLPDAEPQSNGAFDAEDCTTMGTINSLETLLGFLGYKVNYSKRANAIAAGTTPDGNSPHVVAETIRSVLGNVNESDLPFSLDIGTWNDYYSPKPLTADLIKKGQAFWQLWDFNHQWVLDGTETDPATQIAKLKAALQISPLGVGVYAWQMGPDGKYIRPPGAADCHWVALVNFKDGEYWEIFDSYDGYLKQLDWNFGFTAAKQYSVIPHAVTINIFRQILNIFAQILHLDSLIVNQLPPSAGPIVTNPPATTPINGEANHPQIVAWAKAILVAEGGNTSFPTIPQCGNLRYSAYVKSLGAIGHTPTGNYAIFPDAASALGCDANGVLNGKGLCQFLIDAAHNQLIPYHQARTLLAFTKIYAGNPPQGYIDRIAAQLKVAESIDISTLL